MPKKPVAVKIPPLCKKTGGKVDDVVFQLLACGNDTDLPVKQQIFDSLTIIGADQPLFVITQSIDYVVKTNPNCDHRTRIIDLCSYIIDDKGKNENALEKLIPETIISSVIQFCTNEMSINKHPEVQNASVKMLVALSFQNCKLVTDYILQYFKTGKLPSYYTLKALADIASANPIAFVDRLGDVFGKITPVLGLVSKSTEMKIFTLALGRFAEAILQFQGEIAITEEIECKVEHKDEDSKDEEIPNNINTKITKYNETHHTFTAFETNCASAFDIIFTNWRRTKDINLRTAIAEALGLLSEVMTPKKFELHFIEIIIYFVQLIKNGSPNTYPPLVRGLCSCLKVMNRDELCEKIDDIEKYMIMSMDILHPIASNSTNYENRKSVKNHSFTLQCFEYLARARLTQTLTYLLNKFTAKTASPKLSSLCILKHIVGHMDDELQGSKSLILSSCQTLMNEKDLRVKKAFIHLIMGMAGQQYLSLEGGQNMILFLVKQSSIKINNFDEKKSKSPSPILGKDSKLRKRLSSKSKQTSNITSLMIRNGAAHILHIIANQVISSHDVLWPYLFELMIPVKYMYAQGDICRVISYLARTKKQSDIPWTTDVNLPHPGSIIVRLFVLLNRPFMNEKYGEYICSCMHSIGGLVHGSLSDLWFDGFKILGQYLQEQKREIVVDKFPGMLLKLYRETCVKLEMDDVFITEMGNSLLKQWFSYKDKLLQVLLFFCCFMF